jgi:hypothetical protein
MIFRSRSSVWNSVERWEGSFSDIYESWAGRCLIRMGAAGDFDEREI